MIETVKIDKGMAKLAAVGLISAALAVSSYGMLDANRQNKELREEIAGLRTKLENFQQSPALVQSPSKTPPVEVKPEPVTPAPVQPAQVSTQPVATKPDAAEPTVGQLDASAGRITFNMLAPGLEARPPLPLEAPVGGITKTARVAKAEAPRGVARSNVTAITDKQDSTWDNQFVLRNKEAEAGDAASGQLTIAGQ